MEEIKKTESDIDSFDILDQLDEESSFNFRAILRLFILNWQWFLISMFIFACGALIYLRYTDPVYQMSAKMLIKEETSNRRSNGQILANMQDLGFVSNSTGIENEVEILKSRILSLEAVKDLKLYVEYRREGRIKKSLIYKSQPINVDLDPESLELLTKSIEPSFTFKITRHGAGYDVESTECDQPFKGSFKNTPDTLKTPYGMLTFTSNVNEYVRPMNHGDVLFVNITSPKLVASWYARGLSVEPTSKMTSIAQLTINDNSAERAYDYLKQLAIC